MLLFLFFTVKNANFATNLLKNDTQKAGNHQLQEHKGGYA